jgi:riboflavin kinase
VEIMAVEQLKHTIKLSAKVVEGFGRGGKQLGCPTANLCREDLGSQLDELPTGIYCGWATVDGAGPYKAVASIGWNPYFKNEVRRAE